MPQITVRSKVKFCIKRSLEPVSIQELHSIQLSHICYMVQVTLNIDQIWLAFSFLAVMEGCW